MNNKILILIPLCLIGFHGTSQVTAQVTAQDSCLPMSDAPMPACPERPHINININNNSKNMSPQNFCAVPGATITVIVTPAGTTASIEGKDGGWPIGSGSSFTITAPADDDVEYNYNVTFQNGDCIDPRITIKR